MVTLSAGASLSRTSGGFLPPATPFTVKFWLRLDGTGNARIAHVLYATDRSYASAYIKMHSDPANVDSLMVTAFNGTTTKTTVPISLVRGYWYPVALWYISSIQALRLLVHNEIVGQIDSHSFSAVTFASEYLGNDGISGVPAVQVAQYRSWTRQVGSSDTGDSLRPEDAQVTPFSATNIFCSTALDSDLLDVAGSARHWTATGSVAFTTGLPNSVNPLLAETFTRTFQSSLSTLPEWGTFQGGAPTIRSGVGCGEGNTFGCGTSSLYRLFETVGRGPSAGTIRFQYARLAVPGSGTSLLLQISDYQNTTAEAAASQFRTYITLAMNDTGTCTVSCRNGAGSPSTPTVITATIASGVIPVNGSTCGIQVLWDLSGANLLVRVYVNDVLQATINTPYAGLLSRTWNHIVWNVIRNSPANSTWSDSIAAVTILPTFTLGSMLGCADAVPLSGVGSCCHTIDARVITNVVLGGTPDARLMTIQGTGFYNRGGVRTNLVIQGSEGEGVAYVHESTTPTAITVSHMVPPPEPGDHICVTVTNPCI